MQTAKHQTTPTQDGPTAQKLRIHVEHMTPNMPLPQEERGASECASMIGYRAGVGISVNQALNTPPLRPVTDSPLSPPPLLDLLRGLPLPP